MAGANGQLFMSLDPVHVGAVLVLRKVRYGLQREYAIGATLQQ